MVSQLASPMDEPRPQPMDCSIDAAEARGGAGGAAALVVGGVNLGRAGEAARDLHLHADALGQVRALDDAAALVAEGEGRTVAVGNEEGPAPRAAPERPA